MLRRAILLCCTLAALAGCASAPPAPPPRAELFDDAAFAPASERISGADVFALSDAMRAFLAGDPASALVDSDPRRRLIDRLFRKNEVALDYDATTTRTAAQAFDQRAGNCLSLVIMTAALAKSIGMPVHYQSVVVDETWSRSGDLYFASGHVNIVLGSSLARSRWERIYDQLLIVDFLPPADLRGQRASEIDERTILAMFMNNRAAEALARGRVDDAYWWAREAVLQDPGFLAGYNTLGVVFDRHGQPAAAQRVFERVLEREPANTKVMGNLVLALNAQGRTDEARRLAERLAQIEPYPPFHFFHLGMAAMERRDFAGASELFRKEIKREPSYHEFHYWLAQAQFALGNEPEARRHLEQAMQSSTTARDHDIYSAKLAWLRSHRAQ
jgi:Tfp pilus assembly protein PilF